MIEDEFEEEKYPSEKKHKAWVNSKLHEKYGHLDYFLTEMRREYIIQLMNKQQKELSGQQEIDITKITEAE